MDKWIEENPQPEVARNNQANIGLTIDIEGEIEDIKAPTLILHGENDGACRVEGVRETQRAFEKAKKENLFIKTYPRTNHDLNWGKFLKDGHIPEAFEDIFDYIDKIVCSEY